MKHVVTMFGIVHPQGGGWFIDELFRTTAADGTEIQISLSFSAYSMRIETDGPTDDINSKNDAPVMKWINEVYYRHQPFLRVVLDTLGLHMGAHLEPEMTGGTLDGVAVLGSLTMLGVFGTQEGASYVGGESFAPTWSLAISNSFAQSALVDVRHALRFDVDSPFFCYRALDSLREHYATTTDARSKKASWAKLRNELDIDEPVIRALKAFADTRRHGGAGTSVHADHLKWTQWTREIVWRFVQKHGDVPPPGSV
ncbi:hypothetical protein A5647_15840 [Mycobacterium sp. 1100029.7]|nr:hypothetical protein A5647_15840 [Mycobacterium sp. 1100029.7]